MVEFKARQDKMEISEIKVNLVNNKDNRLKAFCAITIGKEFVIRDIKVIEGGAGYFVAMPSRKMSDHCEKCGGKNHLRAKFCNNCGVKLKENRSNRNDKGKIKDNKAINGELKVIREKLDEIERDLRDRVETLERIVTSPKEDLKRQFDHLDKAS